MHTVEEFNAFVKAVEADKAYARPAIFAIGVAAIGNVGKVLDTYFPVVNVGENFGSAAVLASIVGHKSGSQSYDLDAQQVERALGYFKPFFNDGKQHANIRALQDAAEMLRAGDAAIPRRVVATFIGDLNAKPVDAHDVYLRLHALSHRKVKPHGLNLEGIFGLLNNVVWTNLGPFDPDNFESTRMRLRARGTELKVHSVDKFPRMTDYVIPSGVRIADADRVRLGAHLAEGTTVMHEGFVNFNAGTLGKSMVEGRISAGVVVGNNSDIGGGASIMGTLSGGGKTVISIGENCLLGANSGLGICLGDNCIIEAGLYVTAGSKVRLPTGATVKARELSGWSNLEFRRNSMTGAIEVIAKKAGEPPNWGGLNAALHAN